MSDAVSNRMGNIEHEWPDEHAIQTVARRLERFGWPYKQNSEAVVRQVVVELRKLEPPQPQGAVEDASQALMDALSIMDPDTARRFMDEASYKRFVRLHTRGQ